MKLKFPSYLTRKFNPYLITLKFEGVTQLVNLSFTKNSELHNLNSVLFSQLNHYLFGF